MVDNSLNLCGSAWAISRSIGRCSTAATRLLARLPPPQPHARPPRRARKQKFGVLFFALLLVCARVAGVRLGLWRLYRLQYAGGMADSEPEGVIRRMTTRLFHISDVHFGVGGPRRARCRGACRGGRAAPTR